MKKSWKKFLPLIICLAICLSLFTVSAFAVDAAQQPEIKIEKNEDGTWPETPEYWYLVVTRTDGVTESEFAIFKCGVSDET